MFKELEEVLDHRNFVCWMVALAQALCTSIARATVGDLMPHHCVRISRGMKKDLVVWLTFLAEFHGTAI